MLNFFTEIAYTCYNNDKLLYRDELSESPFKRMMESIRITKFNKVH